MHQTIIRKDWVSQNKYTTAHDGIITSNNAGVIKAVGPNGEKYSVGKIEYQYFEDESFQYIISPFWDVIDGLPGRIFQGIPGIKMELRLEHYYRVNYTPVFISERTPSSEREDMWELMESVGLDYYDRLEWLIRTPLRSGNDNLIVERWRSKPLHMTYGKSNKGFLFDKLQFGDTVVLQSLQDLSTSIDGMAEVLNRLLGIGVNIECTLEGRIIPTSDIPVLLPIIIAARELYLNSRKAKQAEGITLAKKQRKYRGRKKLHVDELKLRSVYERVRLGNITVDDAMKDLNISSKSTFYRRVREIKQQAPE